MFRFKLDVLGDSLIKRYIDVFSFYICYNDFESPIVFFARIN